MPYQRKQATVPLVSAANPIICPFSELFIMDLDTLRHIAQLKEEVSKSMKKLLVFTSVALLLSGCSLTSNYTVASAENVEATISFAVPKSTLRGVSTVDQWSQILQSNNFPTPTLAPSPGSSASPSCEYGEDVELGQWNYICSAVGDISLLNESSSSDSPASLRYTRDGKTLHIVQPASDTSGGSDNPFSLSGVSLFYAKTTLTFPGLVTEVTDGAEKVDDHTVSFEVDQNQQTEMTATIELDELTSTATNLDLTTKASALAAGSADVELTASVIGSSDGQVTFFDGDTLLGFVDVNEQGVAKYIAGIQADGTHQYRAEFQPRDWWNVDTSQDQTSLTFKTFKMTNYPSISGSKKVGASLGLANLNPRPAASRISYQWLRNGKAISGKTSKDYKVAAADYNKNISVRITLVKPGYLANTFETSAIRINKR